MMKIAVVGDIMLDEYLDGDVVSISQEAPVPILTNIKTKRVFGGAANVYQNLVGLKVETFLCGFIGNDIEGDFIRNEIIMGGGSINGLIVSGSPTTLKRRILSGGKQIVRIDREKRCEMNISDIDHLIIALRVFSPDAIIISDYGKGVVTKELVRCLKESFSCFFGADPKNDISIFKDFDIVTPNKREFLKYGFSVKTLLNGLNIESVLITNGKEGMELFYDGGSHNIPTVEKTVCDVSGAGDTVIAVYTFFKLIGYSREASASFANLAAGIVVGEQGTFPINIELMYPYIFPLKLTEKTEKVWGNEICFANCELYCGKILNINQGYICSNHYHKIKDETFYVLKGKVYMEINGGARIFVPGDSVRIFPNDKHRFGGILPSVMIEVSTQHFEDDSYRLSESSKWDDYERYLK